MLVYGAMPRKVIYSHDDAFVDAAIDIELLALGVREGEGPQTDGYIDEEAVDCDVFSNADAIVHASVSSTRDANQWASISPPPESCRW